MSNWVKKLTFNVGFMESGNAYIEAVIDFYNLICMSLILISFLIVYWLLYILTNNTFKSIVPIYKSNLSFEDKLKQIFLFYWNRSLVDASYEFLAINDIKDYPVLEANWTLVPICFVALVTYPSISLEYGISPDITPAIIVKVVAHQWYWTVNIRTTETDFLGFSYMARYTPEQLAAEKARREYMVGLGYWNGLHSYPTYGEGNDIYFETHFENSRFHNMLKEKNWYASPETIKELIERIENFEFIPYEKDINISLIQSKPNFYRMLSVDSRIVLPVNTPIKFIITSSDVLHSFALPSLGLKIDAVPGRLSQQIITFDRPGIYWGQCSELCGPYHGFMPIVFEISTIKVFINFMRN